MYLRIYLSKELWARKRKESAAEKTYLIQSGKEYKLILSKKLNDTCRKHINNSGK